MKEAYEEFMNFSSVANEGTKSEIFVVFEDLKKAHFFPGWIGCVIVELCAAHLKCVLVSLNCLEKHVQMYDM